MTDFRHVREAAGISRDKAAVQADVSYPTARIFEEAGPGAIKDPGKRARLIATYESLRAATAAKAA